MSDLKIQTEWLPQLSADEFDPEAAAHMTGSRGSVAAMPGYFRGPDFTV